MFKNMTKQDFLDWWAYNSVEPIGAVRSDYHAASICLAITNGFSAMARSRKRFKLKDFLLEWKDVDDEKTPEEPKQPWQAMKLVARMWAAASKVDESSGRRPSRGRTNKVNEAKVAEARAALKAADRRPKR